MKYKEIHDNVNSHNGDPLWWKIIRIIHDKGSVRKLPPIGPRSKYIIRIVFDFKRLITIKYDKANKHNPSSYCYQLSFDSSIERHESRNQHFHSRIQFIQFYVFELKNLRK